MPDRSKQHERDRQRNQSRYLPTNSTQWRAIRKAQLEQFPLCAHCGDVANEADHIQSDTRKNIVGVDLQSLCKPCHSTKTAGGGVKGCDVTGQPRDPNHHWNRGEKSLEPLPLRSARPPSLHR